MGTCLPHVCTRVHGMLAFLMCSVRNNKLVGWCPHVVRDVGWAFATREHLLLVHQSHGTVTPVRAWSGCMRAPSTPGCCPSAQVRSWRIWNWFHTRLNTSLVVDAPIDPLRQHIIGA